MAQNIARLGVVLGLATAEFTKGLGDATLALSRFVEKSKTQIAIGTAGMTALIAKTVAYADKVTDLAEANDISISSVMALSSALAVSGGRADNAGKLLAGLTKKIDDVTQGVESAQEPFERLGISLKEIASSSNEELLRRVSNALAKIEDPIKRNAIAMDLFSKAGKNISWSAFSSELENATTRFKDSEAGIKAMAETADNLNIIWTTLMSTIAKSVGEELKAVVDYLSKIQDQIGVVGTVFKTVFQVVAVLGSDLLFIFERFVAVFGRFELGLFASKEAVAGFWEKYNKESEEARQNLDKFQRQIMGLNKSTDADAQEGGFYGKSTKIATERAMELAKQQQQMLAMAKLLSVEYERQQQFALQQLKTRNAMAGMTEDERRIQEAVNKVLDDTSKKIDDITKRREEAVGRKAGQAVIDEYDRQIVKIQEIGNRFAELTRNQEAQAIQAQRTFQFGWEKAFNQFVEDAYNYGRIAEESFKSITDNMTSAIDNFVETGKFSFSDFASSVIKDLIKIQLRMSAMQMFGQAGGFLGSLFGGGGTGFGTATMSESAVLAGRTMTPLATGGMANAGFPHLVGENGPELFIPQRSGTVIPNQQMSGMTGDQPTIVYNGPYIAQMSAIDTQSATQFLSQNKLAVWSANQSASRGMPTSR